MPNEHKFISTTISFYQQKNYPITILFYTLLYHEENEKIHSNVNHTANQKSKYGEKNIINFDSNANMEQCILKNEFLDMYLTKNIDIMSDEKRNQMNHVSTNNQMFSDNDFHSNIMNDT